MSKALSLQERFEDKVELIPFSTCHFWNACANHRGYGQISIGAKMVSAHRASYELYVDKIPEGMHVLHKCDNPPCVNPDHLFLGTNYDNVKDRDSKGRQVSAKGEDNPGAKLKECDVIDIRSSEMTKAQLSRKYNVSHRLIRNVINRTAWRHV